MEGANRVPRTRRVSSWILLVLASLLIPVSVISLWAIRTVTDTNHYVETMAPLARNQVIVDHLATKATDALFSTHIVENAVTEALPRAAKPIVAPVVAVVHQYVYNLALKVFESPTFGRLWDQLNARTHDAAIDILTGKQSSLTTRIEKGGQVVLNVTPVMNDIIASANARGITLFNPLKPILSAGDSLDITILSKGQVSKFSGWFNLVVKLKWAIPALALGVAILAIVAAVERRKTLLRLGVGVALMALLLVAGLSLGRITFLNEASGHSFNRDVAAAVWDTMLRFLKSDLRWTLLIAGLGALGAWVAGPTRDAVWIRSTTARGGRWMGIQARSFGAGIDRAAAGRGGMARGGGWILEHVKGLRAVGVVMAALFVVFGGDLTGWTLLVILAALAAYMGLLQLVASWVRRVAGPTSGAA